MEDAEYLNLIAEGRFGEARKALDGLALEKGAYATQSGDFRFYHGSVYEKAFTRFRGDRSIFLTTSRRVALSYAGQGGIGGDDIENAQFDYERLKDRWERLKSGIREAKDAGILSTIADFLTDVIGFQSEYVESAGIFASTLDSDSYDDKAVALFRTYGENRLTDADKSTALKALSSVDRLVSSANRGTVYWLYAFSDNPLAVDAEGSDYGNVPFDGGYESTDDIVARAWDMGYDCVEISNVSDGVGIKVPDEATDIVLRNPNQVKSANLVTFDDDGNIIPLSKRFSDSDDIREEDSMSEWLRSQCR